MWLTNKAGRFVLGIVLCLQYLQVLGLPNTYFRYGYFPNTIQYNIFLKKKVGEDRNNCRKEEEEKEKEKEEEKKKKKKKQKKKNENGRKREFATDPRSKRAQEKNTPFGHAPHSDEKSMRNVWEIYAKYTRIIQ